MTLAKMSYWAIEFKIGVTVVAILVLYIVIGISRKINRIRQTRIDQKIIDSPSPPSEESTPPDLRVP